jgi:hypothetical protein
MICYKDSTFCSFWKDCQDGKNCSRALTNELIKKANKWWGSDNAPICIFIEKPNCFKEIKNEQKN